MKKSLISGGECITDESSEESETSPKNIGSNTELKFQLSQEIYDMLLRNISPQLDDNDDVVIEFENLENKKEEDDACLERFKEILNYTSLVVINPKKNPKKANLIYFEEEKCDNSENNINSQYFEQIRDISIAKIWIKSCIFVKNMIKYYINISGYQY